MQSEIFFQEQQRIDVMKDISDSVETRPDKTSPKKCP